MLKIQFKKNDEGIGSANIGGGTVPYAETSVIAFDGLKARSLQGATASEFAGLAVAWQRNQPLPNDNEAQVSAEVSCSYEWTPSKEMPSVGFSVPEQDAYGGFRWTIAKQARVILPACDQPYQIEVKVAFALSDQNIAQFGLIANGTTIPVDRTNIAGGVSYIGKSNAGTNGKPLILELSVPNLDRPSSGPRELGVAVRQVIVSPIAQ